MPSPHSFFQLFYTDHHHPVGRVPFLCERGKNMKQNILIYLTQAISLHVLVWFLSSNYVWTFGSFSLYKEAKTRFLYVSLTVSFFLFTRNHVETPDWCWESSSTHSSAFSFGTGSLNHTHNF